MPVSHAHRQQRHRATVLTSTNRCSLSRLSRSCVVAAWVCGRVVGCFAVCCRGRDAPQQLSYSCKCSFYEIFNEKVFDLVDESNRDNPMGLTVREDTRKGVYVEGLMEEDVSEGHNVNIVIVTGMGVALLRFFPAGAGSNTAASRFICFVLGRYLQHVVACA